MNCPAYSIIRCVAWLVILPGFLIGLPRCAAQSGADRITLLDGTELVGEITSIDPAGTVVAQGIDQPLRLAVLRRIDRVAAQQTASKEPQADPLFDDEQPVETPIQVELADGGKLRIKQITLADEVFNLQRSEGDPVPLSIDAMRAIRFDASTPSEEFLQAVRAADADLDQLFVRIDEKLQVIKGLVHALSEKEVVFQRNNERRTIPRSQLAALVVASAGGASPSGVQCLVETADGTSLWASSMSLPPVATTDAKPTPPRQIALKLLAGATISVPWNQVRRVSCRSPGLVFLSDLKPVAVRQQPLVVALRPWRADLSVTGAELSLAGRTYKKGLGTASGSSLSFAKPDESDLLVATIGIDDDANGRGDCEFVVLGDGQELARQRMTGKTPPHALRIDIRDCQRVTLVVEPGADLDLADHANWCDACFVRQAPPSGSRRDGSR